MGLPKAGLISESQDSRFLNGQTRESRLPDIGGVSAFLTQFLKLNRIGHVEAKALREFGTDVQIARAGRVPIHLLKKAQIGRVVLEFRCDQAELLSRDQCSS